MKSLLAIIFAAALLQGCNGMGADSMDEGTSAGNDTITTEDRYKDGAADRIDGGVTEPYNSNDPGAPGNGGDGGNSIDSADRNLPDTTNNR